MVTRPLLPFQHLVGRASIGLIGEAVWSTCRDLRNGPNRVKLAIPERGRLFPAGRRSARMGAGCWDATEEEPNCPPQRGQPNGVEWR